MEPELSIIIVNYNVSELLQKCIGSVYKHCSSAFEILLIDNNSTDNSISIIREKFPEVKIIENKFNAGFPKANNQGIDIAKGKYILLLNPDTELQDDAIGQMIGYMRSNVHVQLMAPKLLNTDLSLQHSIQRFITVKEIIAETFFLHSGMKKRNGYFNEYKEEILQVEALSGAAILMKKEVVEKIGKLDEELFWTEDMEFCYRASLHGIDRIYYPMAAIVHHVGQSGKKNLSVMISNQVLTKINYFKKNHSSFQFFTVKVFRFIHVVSRIIIFGLLSLFGKNYRLKCEAYLYTMRRFLKHDY